MRDGSLSGAGGACRPLATAPCLSSDPLASQAAVPIGLSLSGGHALQPRSVGPGSFEWAQVGAGALVGAPPRAWGQRPTSQLITFWGGACGGGGPGAAAPSGPTSGGEGQPPPRVTVRRVVVSLRGPGQSPGLPFACCVGSLRSVGRCGRCSCGCRCRVGGAQWSVCWGCAGCGGMCRLRVTGAQ